MIKVYIAGPYSHGDKEQNVLEAQRIGALVIRGGGAPFVPHLSHHFHANFPHPYQKWLQIDLAFLECCDLLFRIPGWSPGADVETERARQLHIPIITSEQKLLEALKE